MKNGNFCFILNMNKLLFLPISLMVVLLGSSCHSQSQGLVSCKENYNQAHAAWAGFYQNSDTALLRKALPLFRKSMACKEIKSRAITMTISILSVLNEFRTAYLFIDSLNTDDFDRPYQKTADSYFLRSKLSESQGDMRSKELFLDSAIRSVDDYLRPKTKFENESFIDLTFLQSQLPTRDRLNFTVDSFKRKYPAQASFIEAGRSTGNDTASVEVHLKP